MAITRRNAIRLGAVGLTSLVVSPFLYPPKLRAYAASPETTTKVYRIGQYADIPKSESCDFVFTINRFAGSKTTFPVPDRVEMKRSDGTIKVISDFDYTQYYSLGDGFAWGHPSGAPHGSIWGDNDAKDYDAHGIIYNLKIAMGTSMTPKNKAYKVLDDPSYIKLIWFGVGEDRASRPVDVAIIIRQVNFCSSGHQHSDGDAWATVLCAGKRYSDCGGYNGKWIWTCATGSDASTLYGMEVNFEFGVYPSYGDNRLHDAGDDETFYAGHGMNFAYYDYDMGSINMQGEAGRTDSYRWKESIWFPNYINSENPRTPPANVYLDERSGTKNTLGLNYERGLSDTDHAWKVHQKYDIVCNTLRPTEGSTDIVDNSCTFYNKLYHRERFWWVGSGCISSLFMQSLVPKVRVIIDPASTGTGQVLCDNGGRDDDGGLLPYWIATMNSNKASLIADHGPSEYAKWFAFGQTPVWDVRPDKGCKVTYTEMRNWVSNVAAGVSNTLVRSRNETEYIYGKPGGRYLVPYDRPYDQNQKITYQSIPSPGITENYVIIVRFDTAYGAVGIITESDHPEWVRDLATYRIDNGYVGLFTDAAARMLYKFDASYENPLTGGAFTEGGMPKAKVHFDYVMTNAKTREEANAATTAANGRYTYRQTARPTGHKINSNIGIARVWGGSDETYRIVDTAMHWQPAILLAKHDPAKHEGEGSGDASLGKARFQVTYWDDYTLNHSGKVHKARAVWETRSDGTVRLADAPVSGSWPFKHDGGNTCPLGTYEVRELSCSPGYAVPADPWHFQVTDNGSGDIAIVFSGAWTNGGREPGTLEQAYLWRGQIEIQKVDSDQIIAVDKNKHDIDLDWDSAQGDATLAGAKFKVYNVSANSYIDSTGREVMTCSKGNLREDACAFTLVTDDHGRAMSAEGALPYGSYLLVEVTPPDGYLVNNAFAEGVPFQVRNHEEWVRFVSGNGWIV